MAESWGLSFWPPRLLGQVGAEVRQQTGKLPQKHTCGLEGRVGEDQWFAMLCLTDNRNVLHVRVCKADDR